MDGLKVNSNWTVLEKLLLAQSVYKYGDGNWLAIARTLNLHRSASRSDDFFTQNSCALQYASLIKDLEDKRKLFTFNASDANIEMPPVLKLARELYMERIQELKLALKVDVEKYRDLKKEVEEIRTGKWDKKLLEKYKALRRNIDESNSASAQNQQTKVPPAPVITQGIHATGPDGQQGETLQHQSLKPHTVTQSTETVEPLSDTIQSQETEVEMSTSNGPVDPTKSQETEPPSAISKAPDNSNSSSQTTIPEGKDTSADMVCLKESANDPAANNLNLNGIVIETIKNIETDVPEEEAVTKNDDRSALGFAPLLDKVDERPKSENSNVMETESANEIHISEQNDLSHIYDDYKPNEFPNLSKLNQTKDNLGVCNDNKVIMSDGAGSNVKFEEKSTEQTTFDVSENENATDVSINDLPHHTTSVHVPENDQQTQLVDQLPLDQTENGDSTSTEESTSKVVEESTVQVDEPAEMAVLNQAMGDTLIPCSGPKETIPVGEESQPTQTVRSSDHLDSSQVPSSTDVVTSEHVNITSAPSSKRKNDSDLDEVPTAPETTRSVSEESIDNQDASPRDTFLNQRNTEGHDSDHASATIPGGPLNIGNDSLDSVKTKQFSNDSGIEETTNSLLSKRSGEDLHSFFDVVKKRKIDEPPDQSVVSDQSPHLSTIDMPSTEPTLSVDSDSTLTNDSSQPTAAKPHHISPDTSDLLDVQITNEPESSTIMEIVADHDSLKSIGTDTGTGTSVNDRTMDVEQAVEELHPESVEGNSQDPSSTIDIAKTANIINTEYSSLPTPDLNNEPTDNDETRVIKTPIYQPDNKEPSEGDYHSLEGSELTTLNTGRLEKTDEIDTSQSNLNENFDNQKFHTIDRKEKQDEEISILVSDDTSPPKVHDINSTSDNILEDTPINVSASSPPKEDSHDTNTDSKSTQEISALSESMNSEVTTTTSDKLSEDIGTYLDSDHSLNENLNTQRHPEARTDNNTPPPIHSEGTSELSGLDAPNEATPTVEQPNVPPELSPFHSTKILVESTQPETQKEDEESADSTKLNSPPESTNSVSTEANMGLADDQPTKILPKVGSSEISSERKETNSETFPEDHLKDPSTQDQLSVTPEPNENIESHETMEEPEVKIEVLENSILKEPEIKQEVPEDISLGPTTRPKDTKPISPISRKRDRDPEQKLASEEIHDGSSEKKVKLEDEESSKITPVRHSRKYSIGKRKKDESEDENDGYEVSDAETSDSGAYFEKKEASSPSTEDKKHKSWKKLISMIWREIANHRFGAVFMHPIKEQAAPGYYEVIKRPMDLKSIKQRIREGVITTTDEFHRDILLMFQNALMYNKTDSEVYNMAMEMRDQVEQEIQAFKKTEAFTKRVVQETPTTRRKTNTEDT